MATPPLSVLSRLAFISIASLSLTLCGCGSGVVTNATASTATVFQGVVLGGKQPIVGANVQLFAASTSGKGSAATLLLSSVTDANGNFSLSGLKCANSTDQVYVIATGGNPTPIASPSHALMSALGNCGNLTSSTPIAINEVTTIASVYALAPYMNTASYDVAADSADATALAAAFASARTLANLATGAAIATGSIHAIPILNKLNSLADSVASCIDSNGSTTACRTFFVAATPPSSTAVPTNSVAAILDIALNPTNNVTGIYNLGGTISPFQPSLSAAPDDWTLFGSSAPATPVITWANPAPITYGTTLSAAQLNATASVPGSFTYSPAAGTTPAAGTDTLSVTFTPTDSTNYSSTTATVSLVVNNATSVINWATPVPISYGTTLSAAQLNATASVPGSFTYSPAAGTTPAVGTDTLSVTFTPTNTTNYSTATATVSLVVNKATPAITWANPAPISYGTTLSAAQLNATASVPGSFTYSPAAGTTPAVGTDTLSVTFTPTDTTNYSSATATVSLGVNKATPVITWATPVPITYGTTLSAAQLNASASVPGSFAYSPAAGTTPAVGTDTLSVTFTPTDTANYSTATATVSLVVNKGNQATPVITWATPAPITYGTTLSAAQLNATASVPGSFVYSPAAGTTPAVGTDTLSVTFTPTDTTNYSSATATVSLVVNRGNQATPVITWAAPAPISYGTTLSATQLNATASVPGSFAYSPAAGTTPAVGTDTLSVTFTPTDTTNYSSATATVSLVVNKATSVITWANPAPISYGTTLSATQLNGTASVPGSFAYSPAAGTTPAVGTDTLSATFTPTDTTNYSGATATVSLVVNKATPVITWATPASITSGTALSATQLNATASVPGTFVYSPAAGTTPAAGTDILSVTFTPTDTTDYNSQTASVTLVVTGGTPPPATDIAIGTTAKVTGARRLGINMGGQTYYDSGQLLRNLVFRNPGFEGETFQTILKCAAVTATSCTDSNIYDLWPANFVQGAQFTFLTGGAAGMTGTVTSSTAGDYTKNQAVSISFAAPANPPKVGDFVVVKWAVPGNAQAGWWTNTSGGATLTTEFADLSPNTAGKQALRITAAAVGQSASVTSYFDTYTGRSFVQMNGTYRIAFRAKSVGGNNQMTVSLIRSTSTGNLTYFYQTIALTPSWQDYTYDFPTAESGSSIGTVALAFNVSGANVLLDDVSLAPTSSTTGNPTAFRDEVVSTLQTLHPGVLRYSSAGNGNSIDNIIAPPYARLRAAYSTEQTEQDDVEIGLHEVLQLCQTVGSEPWYSVPVGITPTDMQHLIEYLAGDASTPYGAKRAARGQVAPWTSVFPVIHLEIGNEVWNDIFHGETMQDPVAYGNWVSQLFAAAKSSPSYSQPSFDLILGSWAAVPWWTGQEMANSGNYDSVDVAPYLFNSLNDTSSNEAIFGPMFAQPEMVDDSPTGTMYLQAQTASAAGTSGVKPANLTVYEVNLSTLTGTASQSTINSVVPSVGAGITVIEHMLLMMRDLGVTVQNVFALPNYSNGFSNTAGGSGETVPLFGTVVDMGGETNLRRPIFLAQQMANAAIMTDVLPTTVSGANPTWNQPLSTNDNIQLNGAHEIQSFAFSDGGTSRSVVLVNLSRTTARPVTFSGAGAPTGTISVSQLTSANLTDNNESTATVNITNTTLTNFQPTTPYSLPPFSMTVFTWQAN